MIKKTVLLILFTSLLLVFHTSGSAEAGSGLRVLDASVRLEFPSKMNFALSAESDVAITDIRLCYRVERMSHARVTSEIYIEFEPDTEVEVGWNWDMRKTGALPPGSSLEHWWVVEDAGGATIETERTEVRVEDDRYEWDSLAEGQITIYWYEGKNSFAQDVLSAAQQALARVGEDTGVTLERPVKIYIYANADDLRGSMIYPQEWTGGVAFTRYGIIAIGIAPDNLEWGNRAIAHELTHLVIHQMTFSPYGGLPTWLNEGLAMNAEGELNPFYEALLTLATDEDILISVRSLASPFSAFAGESALAYAQSYAVVKFLIDNYGKEKMFKLLTAFKQGSGYDEALVRVYGFDMDELDALWREYITTGKTPVEATAGRNLCTAAV